MRFTFRSVAKYSQIVSHNDVMLSKKLRVDHMLIQHDDSLLRVIKMVKKKHVQRYASFTVGHCIILVKFLEVTKGV